MRDIDTVRAFLTAVEAKDFQKAASYLSETFRLQGTVSKQPGKYVFLGILTGLAYGFPDYSFHPQALHVFGSTIQVTVHFTGTHTGFLHLSLAFPGLPAIPPTGKKLSGPASCLEFTVHHDKIVKADLNQAEESIVLWILTQLDIALPTAR